jgi:CheY-like chemotaxis protein
MSEASQRVLVVDDRNAGHRDLRTALTAQGCKMLGVSNEQETLNTVMEYRTDLIRIRRSCGSRRIASPRSDFGRVELTGLSCLRSEHQLEIQPRLTGAPFNSPYAGWRQRIRGVKHLSVGGQLVLIYTEFQ